jgi:uncharacterized protein YmfQ (DUF2313 family)
MGMNVPAWLASLQALLPPGRAFTRESGANLTKLLEATAAMFSSAESLAVDLRIQSADPLTATGMLPDWERLLGLPDDCTITLPLSTAERQRLAFARLTEQGGQSRAYFIALAASLGEPGVTIADGFRPMTCNSTCNASLTSNADRFVWIVNVPRSANQLRGMNCNNNCNSALGSLQISLAECPITERKPAHTTVLFKYLP